MVDESRTRRPFLASALVLGIILVLCKAQNLAEKGVFRRATFEDLLVASHEDAFFVLASTLVAGAILLACSRWRTASRIVYGAWVAYGAIVIAYAVIASRAYRYLWVPITYRLLAVGGGLAGLWSSVRGAISFVFVITFFAAPAFFVWISTRRVKKPTTHRLARALVRVMLVVVILVATEEGDIQYQRAWSARLDRTLALSPHVVLGRSLLIDTNASIDRPARGLDATYGESETADFARPFPSPPPIAKKKPRGVILYVLESTGAEYLDSYGGPYNISQRLTALAKDGVLFEHAYANVGRTEAALATLTLSTYLPFTWRYFTMENTHAEGTTLPELLRAQGFFTEFYSAADLDYANQREFVENRGYDKITDAAALAALGCERVSKWGVSDACLVDALLKSIDDHPGAPFFFLAWTNQTHHPYPQPKGREKQLFSHESLPKQQFDFDAYLSSIAESDRQLGRLADGLASRGILDDTLLAITGDHSEAFGQRHLAFVHGLHVYDEEVRIPFVIRFPNGLDARGRDSRVCSQIDFTPTLAHLAGIPQAASWFGRSVFDPTRPNRAYLYASSGDLMVGIREPGWKYVVELWDGHDDLYDLDADPGEQKNLASDRPGLTIEPRARLAAWFATDRALWRQGTLETRPPKANTPPSASSGSPP